MSKKSQEEEGQESELNISQDFPVHLMNLTFLHPISLIIHGYIVEGLHGAEK